MEGTALVCVVHGETGRDGGHDGADRVDGHAQAPLKLYTQGSQTFSLRARQKIF